MAKRPRTTKSATVRKIVPSVIPSESEKAEIELHDGDHLYKEIRIDNRLENASGKKVRLKKDAEAEVTIEAEEKDISRRWSSESGAFSLNFQPAWS